MLRLEDINFVGQGLHRPECVLTTQRGDIYAADWRGGVSHLEPNGQISLYTGSTNDLSTALQPNGIALDPSGAFLIAHLGAEEGGVFRLTRDGMVTPVLREVDGQALPPTNFVLLDHQGRIWITVSTRKQPRALGYRKDCDDGFIVLLDARGARIVADGLGYTNEVQVDPSGQYLYVNETFARRTSRFPILSGGKLGNKEVVAEYDAGIYPDGLTFDVEGAFWITSIISNSLVRVLPNGEQHLELQDADPQHLAWVETAYQASELGRPHLDKIQSQTLKNISSLAFGGADLKTAYLGCLLGDKIATVKMSVAGIPPVHWIW
jgi:sugar lactone lactonase YvrE